MPKEKIKFLKTRDVKSPNRAYETDAGIDFFVPNFDKKFIHNMLDKEENADAFEIILDKESPKYPEANAFNGQIYITSCSTVTDGASLPQVPQDLFGFDIEEGKPFFILRPQKRVNIPSGISCSMAKEGRALIVANKSGVASRKGLVYGAQVVDYSYTGEIHLNVINTSDKNVKIYAGDKLVQMVETPIFTSEVVAISDMSKWADRDTDRGDGGFGSTDKKE